LTGSSLIRIGALKLAPPLVLRANMTLVPPPLNGCTLVTM
jgi:hypothetical protein